MSVTIGNQGSQYFVELSHGGKAVQIPCKDEKEAEKVAKEAKIVEQKIEAQEKKQGKVQPQPDLAQGTPPAGVGEKLDKAA